MEEGTSADVPGLELGLLVGERAEFRFFATNQRREDTTGMWLDPLPEELDELPPLETTLPMEPTESGPVEELIPVHLKSVLTDLGTLELWCQSADENRQWRLEFRTREGG
jgi:hypothetical protein